MWLKLLRMAICSKKAGIPVENAQILKLNAIPRFHLSFVLFTFKPDPAANPFFSLVAYPLLINL